MIIVHAEAAFSEAWKADQKAERAVILADPVMDDRIQPAALPKIPAQIKNFSGKLGRIVQPIFDHLKSALIFRRPRKAGIDKVGELLAEPVLKQRFGDGAPFGEIKKLDAGNCRGRKLLNTRFHFYGTDISSVAAQRDCEFVEAHPVFAQTIARKQRENIVAAQNVLGDLLTPSSPATIPS